MTTNFIYPEVIFKVQETCEKHLLNNASMDELQNVIQFAESSIVDVDEKDLREFFTDCEGKLELIRFTIDDDKQLVESQKIATKILQYLNGIA